MRPTVIRLIAGGALGVAFAISLTLPGSVVFPEEQPIRQLAAPEAPSARVLHAAPVVELPSKAPGPRRVVVRRVYMPGRGIVPATSSVRNAAPRSSRSPAERAPAPVKHPVTPLAAPPAAPVSETRDEQGDEPEETDEPKKADAPKEAAKPRKAGKPKAEKPRKADKPKKSEKPKKAKKPEAPGSKKKDRPDKQDRDDEGDDRGGRDRGEHGRGRGDDSSRG